MLKIRKEQLDELTRVSLKRFENDTVEHIQEFFPKYYEVLGEPTVREVIEYGIDRAESYGFTSERNVSLYINLLFLLGSDFETDMQLPWAATVLNDKRIKDSVTRADKLYDKAMEYLDEVAGVEGEYLGRVLQNLREVRIEEFSHIPSGDIERKLLVALRRIWPQKCGSVGESTLVRLVEHADKSANQYLLSSDYGAAIYATLMFILGSGFYRDPQFSWAGAVLNDEAMMDPAEKSEQLYREAIVFVEK